jgi:hypothetical protein
MTTRTDPAAAGSAAQVAHQEKEKPTMYEEDLFVVVKAILVFPEISFDHEQHRADLSLVLILAGILGTRPGALVEGSFGPRLGVKIGCYAADTSG